MNKKVRIFTLSTCSHCKDAKAFLASNDVEYECTDIDLLEVLDRAEAIQEVKKVNPRISFPTIIIGETVVVGFREDEIREALGL